MSENATQPVFNVQRIYLKDVSLEIPNAPNIFLQNEAPAVEVQLEVVDQDIVENIHEVEITVTLTTRIKDQVAFLVEAKQAGIFEIRDVPKEQIEPILGIVCPNIIYPYLRANIADMITRTGFPPIHLAEINFEAYFQQRKMAQQNKSAGLVGADGAPVQ